MKKEKFKKPRMLMDWRDEIDGTDILLFIIAILLFIGGIIWVGFKIYNYFK